MRPTFPRAERTLVINGDPADRSTWFNLQYMGGRKKGAWQKWEFDYDPDQGVQLSVDGKPSKRFDWNKTKASGFDGLVLYGDETEGDSAQTVWVSGVDYELGPPMETKPVAPPPPPPVVPESDPAPEGEVPQINEAMRGKHPRLFFTAETLPALKEFYASEAAARWREQLEKYAQVSRPFEEPKFQKDATDGQRQGFWRLPTAALHYTLTGDPESFENAKGFLEKLLELKHWEIGKETDSGMSSANIMVGAALAYDWLYNDLNPDFRERFGEKLFQMARAQYHGGHLTKNPGPHYWQADPLPNHRFHRDAGLTLAVLASYEGRPEQQWLLQQTIEELEFVNKWLPEDGTSHESPGYLVFGGNHLVLAMKASDDVVGTTFLDAPFFKNVGLFLAHTSMPGFSQSFGYGDWNGKGFGQYNNFRLLTARLFNQPESKDAVMRVFENSPDTMQHGWFSLLWDSADSERGDATTLPKDTFWPDIGLAIMRDSWADGAASAWFKCGPMGGYILNKFRNENDGKYINVAHDDPDANSFVLGLGSDLLAETDRYSKHKKSSHHNTILINQIGQIAGKRPEGAVFSQPGGDMSKMGIITAWRDLDGITAVEGEAAGSYPSYQDRKTGKSRPALDRFRRTFLWVEGEYVLVLDDIRAPEPVEMTWLIQSPKLEQIDENQFVLQSNDRQASFELASDQPLEFAIQESEADNRGELLGFQQLRASANAGALRIASVYNLWSKSNLSVRLEPGNADEATVTVTSSDTEDVWDWKAGPASEASTLSAKRVKGEPDEAFPFELNPSNSSPPPPL